MKYTYLIQPVVEYDEYRDVTQKSNSKEYTLRYGCKGDGCEEEQWTKYALIYDSSIWNVQEARSHSERHDVIPYIEKSVDTGKKGRGRPPGAKNKNIQKTLKRGIRHEK